VNGHGHNRLEGIIVSVESTKEENLRLVLNSSRREDASLDRVVAVGHINDHLNGVRVDTAISGLKSELVEVGAIFAIRSTPGNTAKSIRNKRSLRADLVSGNELRYTIGTNLGLDLVEETTSRELGNHRSGSIEVAERATLELNELESSLKSSRLGRNSLSSGAVTLDILNVSSTESRHVEDGLVKIRTALLTVHRDREASSELTVKTIDGEGLSMLLPSSSIKMTSVGIESGSVTSSEGDGTNRSLTDVARASSKGINETKAKLTDEVLVGRGHSRGGKEDRDEIAAKESITNSLDTVRSSERLVNSDDQNLASTRTPVDEVSRGRGDLNESLEDGESGEVLSRGGLNLLGEPVQITRVGEGLDHLKTTARARELVHANSKVGVGAENREHLLNELLPSALVGGRPAVEVHHIPNNLLGSLNIDHNLKREINIANRVDRGEEDIGVARSDRERILLSETARDVSIEGVAPVSTLTIVGRARAITRHAAVSLNTPTTLRVSRAVSTVADGITLVLASAASDLEFVLGVLVDREDARGSIGTESRTNKDLVNSASLAREGHSRGERIREVLDESVGTTIERPGESENMVATVDGSSDSSAILDPGLGNRAASTRDGDSDGATSLVTVAVVGGKGKVVLGLAIALARLNEVQNKGILNLVLAESASNLSLESSSRGSNRVVVGIVEDQGASRDESTRSRSLEARVVNLDRAVNSSPALITLALVRDAATIAIALVGASRLAARINHETRNSGSTEALSRAVNLVIGDSSSDTRVNHALVELSRGVGKASSTSLHKLGMESLLDGITVLVGEARVNVASGLRGNLGDGAVVGVAVVSLREGTNARVATPLLRIGSARASVLATTTFNSTSGPGTPSIESAVNGGRGAGSNTSRGIGLTTAGATASTSDRTSATELNRARRPGGPLTHLGNAIARRVLHVRRRASKNGRSASNSRLSRLVSKRHLRDRLSGEVIDVLSNREVIAPALTNRGTNKRAVSSVNTELISHAAISLSDLDKAIVASLDHNHVISELVGGVIVVDEVSATRENGPATPSAVLNLETRSSDAPVVVVRGLDGDLLDATVGLPVSIDGETSVLTIVATNNLSSATLGDKGGDDLSGISGLEGDTREVAVLVSNRRRVSGSSKGANGAINELTLDEGLSARSSKRLGEARVSANGNIVEGEVSNEVVRAHKREELSGEPLSIVLGLGSVEDDDIVQNAIEAGLVAGAESNETRAVSNRDTTSDLVVGGVGNTVDEGRNGGDGSGVVHSHHEVLPLVALDNTVGGSNLIANRDLEHVGNEANFNEIRSARSSSRVNASRSSVANDIDNKGEARSSKRSLWESDLAPGAIENKGNINRSDITLEAARLDTASVNDQSEREKR